MTQLSIFQFWGLGNCYMRFYKYQNIKCQVSNIKCQVSNGRWKMTTFSLWPIVTVLWQVGSSSFSWFWRPLAVFVLLPWGGAAFLSGCLTGRSQGNYTLVSASDDHVSSRGHFPFVCFQTMRKNVELSHCEMFKNFQKNCADVWSKYSVFQLQIQ